MLDPHNLAEYIGFSEKEVKNLCKNYNIDFNEMKKWYDGYCLEGLEIYNPQSVVEVITRRKFKDYWTLLVL